MYQCCCCARFYIPTPPHTHTHIYAHTHAHPHTRIHMHICTWVRAFFHLCRASQQGQWAPLLKWSVAAVFYEL